MTVVRRILIAVVGLLLLLDVGALAYVKFASGPAPSEAKSKLAIWIDDEGQANAALKLVEEMEYKAVIKTAVRDEFVEADYRVVMTADRRELLDPVAKILKKAGHKNLSFNDEGTELYYGGVYPTKAKAKKVAARLMEEEKFGFDIEPGKKKVQKPSFKVVIYDVPENLITNLTDPIEEEYEVVSIDEYPNEPVEEEVEEESEEEVVEEEDVEEEG
jgi:hypothetical protein